MLGANPLDDISNTRTLESAWIGGTGAEIGQSSVGSRESTVTVVSHSRSRQPDLNPEPELPERFEPP